MIKVHWKYEEADAEYEQGNTGTEREKAHM